MREELTLSHVKWECKYHVVLVPKYRKKVFYGPLRKEVGLILKDLLGQKGVAVLECHAMPDHIHLCLSIPPKLSISSVMGFVKGKSAIIIHRRFLGKNKNFTGMHFWSRGYFVSSVGLNEEVIKAYIRNQEKEERRDEQMGFV